MWEVAEYAIDRVIAEEADWACFEATHIVLPRRVRITVATAPSAAHWILREAHVLESLRHLGVPRVYDCGFVPGEGDTAVSLPWVAIEPVAGKPVGSSLSVSEVATLLREVGGILAYAHARGVIHRDVSLHSIVNDSSMRLVDWRRARAGTQVEAADDIYALGLAAYAVMPAKPPRRLAALIADMLARCRLAPDGGNRRGASRADHRRAGRRRRRRSRAGRRSVARAFALAGRADLAGDRARRAARDYRFVGKPRLTPRWLGSGHRIVTAFVRV